MIFPCKFNLDKKCDYDNYKDCAVCVTEEIREEVSRINLTDRTVILNEVLQIIDSKLEEMRE